MGTKSLRIHFYGATGKVSGYLEFLPRRLVLCTSTSKPHETNAKTNRKLLGSFIRQCQDHGIFHNVFTSWDTDTRQRCPDALDVYWRTVNGKIRVWKQSRLSFVGGRSVKLLLTLDCKKSGFPFQLTMTDSRRFFLACLETDRLSQRKATEVLSYLTGFLGYNKIRHQVMEKAFIEGGPKYPWKIAVHLRKDG